jgi:hypothetical protein
VSDDQVPTVRKRRYWVVLASWLSIVSVVVLIGLAVGGLDAAAHAVAFLFGATLLAFAAFMLNLALRTGHADEDWTFIIGFVVLRAAAGLAAIGLALGGGALAGWAFTGFLLSTVVWGPLLRKLRTISQTRTQA